MIPCPAPECFLEAEAEPHGEMLGADFDGSLRHFALLRVTCAAGHHFSMLEDDLDRLQPGRAGREAIHDFGEALDRLAE